MLNEPKPYVPKRFPTWIETPAGNRMIVNDCKTMSAMMGEEYDENAELVVKKKLPPSMEEILAAGYSQAAAEGIFAEEHAKAEQGIEPYGSKPSAEFVPTAPASAPEHTQTIEEVMEAMAKQSEASHAEVLHDADPMGIFATPEPDAPDVPDASPDKKRRKTAKE